MDREGACLSWPRLSGGGVEWREGLGQDTMSPVPPPRLLGGAESHTSSLYSSSLHPKLPNPGKV